MTRLSALGRAQAALWPRSSRCAKSWRSSSPALPGARLPQASVGESLRAASTKARDAVTRSQPCSPPKPE